MSTNEEHKRARERYFLDEFLRHVPGLRFVEHGPPPDWPDFVVADERGLLGLELTQLFCDDGAKGSPTVAEEQWRTNRMQEIARRYYADGGPPAHVTAVRFDSDGFSIADAVRLLRKAADRPGPGPHAVRVPNRSKRWQRPWAELYLSKVPPECGQYVDWTACENTSGWVRRLTPEALGACIAGKTAKLANYRRHLERVALLIYVERSRASGMIEPASDQFAVSGGGFDAVYLLQHLRVGGPPVLRIDANQGLASGPTAL